MYSRALISDIMAFALPNIYVGNYSKLIIFPLSLIIIALFFTQFIPYGIDFKGGTLLTLQLANEVDEGTLRTALDGIGLSNYHIKTYQNPGGWVAEIEMLTDERIVTIDKKLDSLDALLNEADTAEAELARLRIEYQESSSPTVAEKISETEKKLTQLLTTSQQLVKDITELSESLAGGKIGGAGESGGPDTSSFNSFNITDVTMLRKARKSVGDMYTEARGMWRDRIVNSIKNTVDIKSYSLEQVSPTLSALFIDRVIQIAFWSVILIFLLIILIFRTPLPILIVLSGATADLVISLGAMGAFGIPLTLSSFAALMMMVGLSLDTDMMLTIKVLKHQENTPRERAYDAFKTGFAMTTTTIAAFVVLLVLGIVTKISTYYQIGAIGVVGLIGDLIATWCLNAVLALWYVEGKIKLPRKR